MARSLLLLICLSGALFCSELFWFSYKIVTVNSVVIYEEKNISPTMIPSLSKTQFLCALDLKYNSKNSLHRFLNENFDILLPCFYQQKIHLIGWNDNRYKRSEDRVELVVEPIRFTVDFKEEFATISIFQ